MVSNKIKGFLSLIGGFCLHFMNGSLYTWSAINSYYASYLRNIGNTTVTLTDVYFMMPSIFLIQYLFMTFGVKVGDVLGVRMSTLIGVVMMTGAYVILLFVSDFILVILAMGIFGCGNGIGNLSVIQNCWKYLPNNKGLVNGIIIGGLGLSSAVLNPLADFIVNPNQIPPEKETGFYPKEVTDNIPTFLYALIGIFVGLSLCAVSLTFPYEVYYPKENKEDRESVELIIGIKDEKNTGSIWQAFMTIPNLQLGIFCFAGPFFCFLLTNTNRTFGNNHNIEQSYLIFMAFFFSLLNGSSRFLWGYLLDKFSFKVLMYFVLFFELLVSCSIYYIVEYPIIYLIENFIIALCLSGTFTMITPTFNLVFGVQNGAKMYGLTGISVGVSSFLGPILTKIFVNEDKDYRTIYFIGAGFVVIDIIALITFKEEPFNYFGKLKEKVENNNEHSLVTPTSSVILEGQPKLTPKYSELIINHNTNSTN